MFFQICNEPALFVFKKIGGNEMTNQEIFSHIDHTLLKAFSSFEEIKKLCQEAIKYQTASVCIPPSYVSRVKKEFGSSLTICTVIGFPLGYSTTKAKLEEAKDALENGADELDMVINMGDVKNKEFEKIEQEIKLIKQAASSHIVKVIIETCYLTEEEKCRLCQIITSAGADYVKTSTGFGTNGAVIDDILLFSKHIGPDVKMKASGGIKTKEDISLFLEAGCDRIGTSSAISLLKGE